MIGAAHPCRIVGVVLLLVGSAAPTVVTAHSEGVEAADPNTPAAVLTFDGAARRYTALRTVPAEWRVRSAGDAAPPVAGHAGHAAHGVAADPAPAHTHPQ